MIWMRQWPAHVSGHIWGPMPSDRCERNWRHNSSCYGCPQQSVFCPCARRVFWVLCVRTCCVPPLSSSPLLCRIYMPWCESVTAMASSWIVWELSIFTTNSSGIRALFFMYLTCLARCGYPPHCSWWLKLFIFYSFFRDLYRRMRLGWDIVSDWK